VELTQEILKKKDQEIFEKADKTKYRSEGFRDASIKTQYGSVPYSRRVYLTRMEDGRKAYVHLLDEELSMGKIGLVSENLAEKIADLATEATYRETAASVSSATGTSVSAQGAWNIMQRIGERISREEEQDVTLMKAGKEKGVKAVPVLFEEMDGVWIRQQDQHHEKKPMQEVKVATTYDGWDSEGEKLKRSTLVGKHVVAGIEDSRQGRTKC